jgi:hypothetical protein
MLREELQHISSTKKDVRNFGLVVGCIFLGIGLWFFSAGRSSFRFISLVGLTLMMLGLAFPNILRPLQRVWMMLAVLLGWMMTHIILAALFFLILTPTAFIARLFGKQFLRMEFRSKNNLKTYWHRRATSVSSKRRLERQF